MNKTKKVIVALVMSACMAFGVVGFAACFAGEPGKSAYEIAVEHGFEGTEAEWLESFNGLAQGEKGDKGDKGDTGAQGEKGDDGLAGVDGNTWLVGTTAPTAEQGNNGDLYLDYTTWNVYHKESGVWVLLGNIKGDKGDKGDNGDSGSQGGEGEETAIKDFGSVTIAANGTFDLDITGVEAGTYYLVAETSGEAADGVLSSTTDTYIYDMYSPLTGGYRSVIIVSETTTTITLTNSTNAEMSANVKLIEFTTPTLIENTEIEVPAINGNNGYVEIPLNESLIGKTVKITIKNSNNIVPAVLDPAKKTLGAWKATDKQEDGSYQKEFTLAATCTSLYFRYSFSKTNRNLIVKIEVVG